MLKKILYFTLMALLTGSVMSSCKKNKGGIAEGKYVLYGYADNGDQIIMDLEVDGEGQITGNDRYKYSSEGDNNTYDVKGNVYDDGNMTLYVIGKGNGETVQTFNVKPNTDSKDKLVLTGTMSDTRSHTANTVELSTDIAVLDKAPKGAKQVQAPSAQAQEDTPVAAKEEQGILNDSPYPIAPGSHTFHGKAEGQYPIVVYLTVSSNGHVSGKMGYTKILSKYGKSDDHYMKLDGSFSGNTLNMSGYYTNGNGENWILDCSDNGKQYRLSGEAYNYNKDKYFSINVSGK